VSDSQPNLSLTAYAFPTLPSTSAESTSTATSNDLYDLATYFNPDHIASVFADFKWTAHSELAILIDIAQNGEPSEQLNAIRQIRTLAQTALTISGRISRTVVHARSAPQPTASNPNPAPAITGASSISNRLLSRTAPIPLPSDPTVRPIDILPNPLTHENLIAAKPHPAPNPNPLPSPPPSPAP
jgi:hypothetical protein